MLRAKSTVSQVAYNTEHSQGLAPDSIDPSKHHLELVEVRCVN